MSRAPDFNTMDSLVHGGTNLSRFRLMMKVIPNTAFIFIGVLLTLTGLGAFVGLPVLFLGGVYYYYWARTYVESGYSKKSLVLFTVIAIVALIILRYALLFIFSSWLHLF